MDLSGNEWVVIAALVAAVVLFVVGGVLSYARRSRSRRRSDSLRRRFGDEYDVVVAQHGRKRGEAELEHRMQQFDELDLERVSPQDRNDLTEQWKEFQFRFLEDPAYSVREAEHLVSGLMRDRGFPSDDFDTRLQALSVSQPPLARLYRTANATFRATEAGETSVEREFEAMVCYRQLFEALLERPEREPSVEGSEAPSGAELRPVKSGTGPR